MGKGEDLGGALVGDHASASVFIDSGRGDNIKYSSLSAVSLQTSGELQRYFVSSVWIYVPMVYGYISLSITPFTFDVQSSNSTVFYCYIIVTCRR